MPDAAGGATLNLKAARVLASGDDFGDEFAVEVEEEGGAKGKKKRKKEQEPGLPAQAVGGKAAKKQSKVVKF